MRFPSTRPNLTMTHVDKAFRTIFTPMRAIGSSRNGTSGTWSVTTVAPAAADGEPVEERPRADTEHGRRRAGRLGRGEQRRECAVGSVDERQIGVRQHGRDAVPGAHRPVREAIEADSEPEELAPVDSFNSAPWRSAASSSSSVLSSSWVHSIALGFAPQQRRPRVFGDALVGEERRPRLGRLGIVPLAERRRAVRRAALGRVREHVDAERAGEVRRARAGFCTSVLRLRPGPRGPREGARP